MNNTKAIDSYFEALITELDIPESAYEKVEARYKDLGDWFSRPEARCSRFSPHIYPQGSFRFGTVIRPLKDGEEYDLDLGCRLRKDVTKTTHTQKELKTLVGTDLEDYRAARGIESALDEKHRCWRLDYLDDLSFHMDTVPSIPEEQPRIQSLAEGMIKAGSDRGLAEAVAKFAGAITDNRLPNYSRIDPDWLISNSEGYAQWFESRVKLAVQFLEKRAFEAKAARVDELPARKWKAPLQRAVQILKRHRDAMFADAPDGKPISIIITTLAGEAYRGEQDVPSALSRVLTDMGKYVRTMRPRVPNPVNPVEDFADKWSLPAYQHLDLEQNFWTWLQQAQDDFKALQSPRDAEFLAEHAHQKFATTLDEGMLEQKLGLGTVATAPKLQIITGASAKPWLEL
jgi:hypothetical protein